MAHDTNRPQPTNTRRHLPPSSSEGKAYKFRDYTHDQLLANSYTVAKPGMAARDADPRIPVYTAFRFVVQL